MRWMKIDRAQEHPSLVSRWMTVKIAKSRERVVAQDQANTKKECGTGKEVERKEAAADAPRKKDERPRSDEQPAQSSVQLRRRSSDDRDGENHRHREGEKPRTTLEEKRKQRVSHPPLSSTKMSLCDRSCKRRASISRHPARSKGHGHKGRQIGPPIGAGRPNVRAPHEAQIAWQKGLCGKGKKEKLEEAEKKRIIEALNKKLMQ